MNNDNELKVGDIAYLASGRKCEIEAFLPDGRFVVTLVFSDEYGDEFRDSDSIIVDKAYRSAPTHVMDERIAQLNKAIKEKQVELKSLRSSAKDAKEENAALFHVIEQNNALRRIRDFVDGNFTHFVFKVGYYGKAFYRIVEKEEALKDEDSYKRKEKLLVLFGDSKGDLSWGINTRPDGSGEWNREITLCHSLEEAKGLVRMLLDKKVEEMREKKFFSEELYESILKTIGKIKDLGWEIPEDISRWAHEDRLADARKRVEDAASALETAKAALLKVEGTQKTVEEGASNGHG